MGTKKNFFKSLATLLFIFLKCRNSILNALKRFNIEKELYSVLEACNHNQIHFTYETLLMIPLKIKLDYGIIIFNTNIF